MRVPNLHTAPKRHLNKIRTFLKKIDSYLEKYKFARRFEGLRLDQISCTAIKHLTNFRTTNSKLLLSIQILCASHFKFVWKYALPWIRNTWISEFFLLFYIISTQTIYVNQKLHTLSRFATLRAISNLLHTLYIYIYIYIYMYIVRCRKTSTNLCSVAFVKWIASVDN